MADKIMVIEAWRSNEIRNKGRGFPNLVSAGKMSEMPD